MHCKRIIGIVVLVSVLTLTAIGTVLIQEQGGRHPMQHGVANVAAQLQLSDAQEAQMEAFHAAHCDEFRVLHDQSRRLKRALRRAIANDADLATLAGLGDRLGQVDVARAAGPIKRFFLNKPGIQGKEDQSSTNLENL